MRILHVNHLLPVEPMDGGRLRKQQQLDALAETHEVWVVGRAPDQVQREALATSRPAWRLVIVPEPMDVARSPIGAAVRDLMAREAFDVVFVSGFAQWPGERAFGGAYVVLDIDSLDGTVFQRMRDTDTALLSAFDIAATEALTRTVCARADLVLACSDVDADQIRHLAPSANVEVVANGIDASQFAQIGPRPSSGPPVVTFTGFLAYWPNASACVYFITEVLPLLRALVPDVQFRMVGRVPPESLVSLAQAHGVELHADVPNIRPWFAESHVMVAPLLAGSGTRLKILEAFAAGRPVVSTTIGCEGLEVLDGEHLLVADRAEPFARAVASLLREPARAEALAARARALLHDRYERTALAVTLRSLVERLGNVPPRGRCQQVRP